MELMDLIKDMKKYVNVYYMIYMIYILKSCNILTIINHLWSNLAEINWIALSYC